MKKIVSVFLLFPIFLKAQECKLISETDPFTKQIRLSSGFVYVDGGSVSIDADNKEVIVLFSVENADKCFDDNTTLEIFFEGIKSKTTARTQSTMNCEGLVQLVFRNTAGTPTTMLQRISTKKIVSINFIREKKKAIVFTPGPKEQEQIMALANCVVTEGKKLIK